MGLGRKLFTAGAVGLVLTLVTSATPSWAVIGGTLADPADYPYFVKIDYSSHHCGGTLISDSWVLTSAVCMGTGTPSLATAHVTGRGPLAVREIRLHPLWNFAGADGHNLALLRLDPGAAAGVPTIQVGAPLDSVAYAVGTEATIMGHGSTGRGSPLDGPFRVLETLIRSDDYMSDIFDPWWAPDEWIEPLMIGAGRAGGTNCYGDGGSPLVVNRDGIDVLVGVYGLVSFTAGDHQSCETAGATMYAEVNGAQLAWIASVVPSIGTRWGPCTRANGQPSNIYTHYVYYPLAGNDGPYNWTVTCYEPPPPPPEDPEPPVPEICRKKPWLCED